MEDFTFYTLESDNSEKKKSVINQDKLFENIELHKKKKEDALFSQLEVATSIVKEYQKLEEKLKDNFKNYEIKDLYNISIKNYSSKYPDSILSLKLNPDYYPLVPPDVSINPPLDPIYMYSIICHPDLDMRNTSKIRNIEIIINSVSKFVNDYDLKCTMNHEITNNMIQLLKTNNFKMKQKDVILENSNVTSAPRSAPSKSGIGYGGMVKTWDVNAYLNNLGRIKEENNKLLKDIIKFINDNPDNNDLMEIHTKFELSNFWIDMIEKYEITDDKYYESIKNILLIIKKLNYKIKIPFIEDFIRIQSSSTNDIVKEIIVLMTELLNDKKETTSEENEYVTKLKPLLNGSYPFIEKNKHLFAATAKTSNFLKPNTARFISKQYDIIKGSLPLSKESAIFFRSDTDNMNVFKFLIIPNEDTPYKYGCFVFDVFMPHDFPNVPPQVSHATSKKNNFRFNPNLYSDGKVCLSLLGTWGGQSQSEKWIPPNADGTGSTLLQLILSIYSMVFREDPWYNEPGRERGIANAETNSTAIAYNKEIRDGTIKYAIINQLRYPEDGFEDVIKEHFRLKKDDVAKYLTELNKMTDLENFNKLIEK